MITTFLVALNLDDLSDLPGQSRDIADDLTHAGFEVVSVKPWTRPTLNEPPAQPPTLT